MVTLGVAHAAVLAVVVASAVVFVSAFATLGLLLG